MNCFEHFQKQAVGTCSHCGRGLCKDCTTVVEGKLSCRGRCQEEVARERQLIANSERAMNERAVVYGVSAKAYHQAFASTAFFGLVFIIVGAIFVFTDVKILGVVLLALGLMLGIRGTHLATAGKKYKSLAASNRVEGQDT